MTLPRRRCSRQLLLWLALGALPGGLLVPRTAAAHPTPGSVAIIDFSAGGARIEQSVPFEELERALHRQLVKENEPALSVVARLSSELGDYALQHLHVKSRASGRSWRVRLLSVEGYAASDGPRAKFLFELTAPYGEASDSVQLKDDVVVHEVVSHYTAIYVREDWAAGQLKEEPKLVGTVHAGRNEIIVERRGSFWRGLGSVVALGWQHIAHGTDHWMFLLTLALVAPVKARDKQWVRRRRQRETIRQLAWMVSSFTLGHSATLVLGSRSGGALPTAWIESGIALSILVSAVHGMRAIFPRREALVAGAFGLVHGLAFASSLVERQLGGPQWCWTVFGFNLGVELAQLGLLSLVVPWLLLLANTRFYWIFRWVGSGVAAFFAAGWLLERTTRLPNPLAPVLGQLERYPLGLLVVFAAAAALARVAEQALSRPGAAES